LVVLLGANVAKGRLHVAAPILATVTLHALGRRFERGERDVGSVFRDLEILAASFPRLIETGDQFVCPAGDGCWVGHIAFAGRDVSLAVQTYKPEPLSAHPAGPPRDIESLLATLPALSFEAQLRRNNSRSWAYQRCTLLLLKRCLQRVCAVVLVLYRDQAGDEHHR
jgi:hypothetical protein